MNHEISRANINGLLQVRAPPASYLYTLLEGEKGRDLINGSFMLQKLPLSALLNAQRWRKLLLTTFAGYVSLRP